MSLPLNSPGSAPDAPFHVVGLGASAGGLEALETFFASAPPESGLAFVVIQHLSPDFKSHLAELLGRRTAIPICSVEDGMALRPDTIYLIPPGKEMIISSGRLLLTDKERDGGLSLPIDLFFRSLAADLGERAIAVVLSGSGSDGSRGIVDVHEAGGLVLCQSEESARFDGMPQSARRSGVVDLVMSPDAMPGAILRYVKERLSREQLSDGEDGLLQREEEQSGLQQIFLLLRDRFGLDFSQYKPSMVARRIERRLLLRQDLDLASYVRQLIESPAELDVLYRDLLIGVTCFFRDNQAFEQLRTLVIPALMGQLEAREQLRVWVAGCATGEEAYSIAMCFLEAFAERGRLPNLKIFATDAHRASLDVAGAGEYPPEALQEVPPPLKEKYFQPTEEGYRVSPELRRMVLFAPHRVFTDPPFTQLDLICCRNMLIYFRPITQKKVLSLFHFALRAGGFLFLGPSESPGELTDEFDSIERKWKIYRKRRDIQLHTALRAPEPISSTGGGYPRGGLGWQSRSSGRPTSLLPVYDRLLEQYMPPAVLTDEWLTILHVFPGAERFLQHRAGRPTANLAELLAPELRVPLTTAVQEARQKRQKIRFGAVPTEEGLVQLEVEAFADRSGSDLHYLVRLEEPERPNESLARIEMDLDGAARAHVRELESELQATRQSLQSMIEELETTNEELVASNEELQSTNEELHSVNEELYTVNAEHQRKIDELTVLTDDMENLLVSTDVGVIFLDRDLKIRRFTPQIARLFRIEAQDVGRDITTFTHNLQVENLAADMRKVLQAEARLEREVFDNAGRTYLMRLLPYRASLGTLGQGAEGVVLVLVDVDPLVRARAELERFRFMSEHAYDMHALLDDEGRIVYANPAMPQRLGYTREALEGLPLADLDLQHNRESLRRLLRRARAGEVAPFEAKLARADGAAVVVEISVSFVHFQHTPYIFCEIRDITSRKRTAQRLAAEHAISLALIDTHRPEDVFPRILESLVQHLDVDVAELWLPDASGALRRTSSFARESKEIQAFVGARPPALDQEGGLPGAVWEEGRPRWMPNLSQRPEFLRRREAEQAGLTDGYALPVMVAERVAGVVAFYSRQSLGFDAAFQDMMIQVGHALGEYLRRVEYEEQLAVAREKADAANEAKNAFLANTSHEIRTPMTAIMGYSDLLLARLQDPDDRHAVQTIRRHGKILLEILDDILDLTRIEAGKLPIQMEQVSLHTIISEVYSMMRLRAEEKGLLLQVEYTTAIPTLINSDPQRLRQILVNLASNAIKFTPEGGVSISVELQPTTNRLFVRVADTGIGIAPDIQSQLFDPFTQADASTTRIYGGTGLGLAISQRLANMLGGEITLQSEPGQGSTFTLGVPAGTIPGVPLIQPPSPDTALLESEPPTLPRLNGRLLLVDDRREVRFLISEMLEMSGGDVETAENGQEAVEAVEDAQRNGRPYDAVLMDMQMPVMDGYTAARTLRKRGYQLPIIALTAHAMRGERRRSMEAGCDAYLVKPVERHELIPLLARMLRPGAPAGADAPAQPDPGQDAPPQPQEPPQPPAPLADSDERPDSAESRLRILVAEDHPDARETIGLLLESLGHEVRLAGDGRSLRAHAESFDPQVLLMDINLPDEDGYSLCRALRPDHPQALFIALTGYSGAEHEKRAHDAGFSHLMTKPLDFAQIETLLRGYGEG